VRQNITVSYGLRFETQNHFSDTHDFAPRLGVAWASAATLKTLPRRAAGGLWMFYDRFAYNLELQQLRYNVNGSLQNEYQWQIPSSFSAAGTGHNFRYRSTNVYQNNPNLHAPYTIQTGVTLERQLTKTANLAVTYLNSCGVHQFYTDNLNPVDPTTGQRVNFPEAGNIFSVSIRRHL